MPEARYSGPVVEIFFTSLLVLVSIVIVWFALYVVYRIYKC